MESEVAYHLHGGYGLFCIEGSRSMHFEPAGTSAAPEEDASLQGLTRFCQHMAANLENWRGSPYQSCCPMCSFMLLNYQANPLYWEQNPLECPSVEDEVPLEMPLLEAVIRSRPQVGFVMPLVTFNPFPSPGIEHFA